MILKYLRQIRTISVNGMAYDRCRINHKTIKVVCKRIITLQRESSKQFNK